MGIFRSVLDPHSTVINTDQDPGPLRIIINGNLQENMAKNLLKLFYSFISWMRILNKCARIQCQP
jgi:hypothetical protein